jgi:hypothetical protein
MVFGKTKSGHFYNKDKPIKDNSTHPITFADAYVDGDEDLKDKHNFADERIAEQEQKDKLDAIKKEQDDAQKQSNQDELRLHVLENIDSVLVSTDDIDSKISLLEDYMKDDVNALTSDDQKELHQEIIELKQLKKSMDHNEKKSNQETKKDDDIEKSHSKGVSIQEKIEDKIDQIRKKKQAEKNGKEEVKTSRRENRSTDSPGKDHSGDNLPSQDEHVRMSYLLATAEDK